MAPSARAAEQPFILPNATHRSNVTDACATLQAEIYPREAETTYHFEYLTEAKFKEVGETFAGAISTPESTSIGSDNTGHVVNHEVCGLARGTTYHFRAVATNSESPPGGTLGGGATFTTLFYGSSHELTASFGGETSTVKDPYPLAGPTDVAIDESGGPSNGDLYVTDPGHHRVEEFDSSGHFLLMFGEQVDKTTGGNVCPEHPGDECLPGIPGPELPCCEQVTDISPGQLNEPALLAVDNAPGGEGDVYVGDPATRLVQKFNASGQIIRAWGVHGQKDGSDIPKGENEPHIFGPIIGLAVNPTSGELYVDSNTPTQFGPVPVVNTYTQSGAFVPSYRGGMGGGLGLKVNPAGSTLYDVKEVGEGSGERGGVLRRSIAAENNPIPPKQVTAPGLITSGFAFDPANEEFYQDSGSLIYHYSLDCNPEHRPCEPFDSFGDGQLSGAAGVSVDGATHTVYVADSTANDVAVFPDIRPQPTTEPATEVGETSLTMTGQVDPKANGEDHGPIAECFFEWGTTRAYGHTASCEQTTPYSTTEAVTAKLKGLTPIVDLPVGTTYHYRLIASNQKGATGQGRDQTAKTHAPPQIEGVSSSHVTATSAELDATVNPNGLATKYRFEYGTTTSYGESTPGAEISDELFTIQKVHAEISNLQRGVTYHFRLVAENALAQAPVSSEDQSFEFFPPTCPNSSVRQQTGSAYLPDCRAYELVSPANANGTFLLPGGPNTGQATSPSRFSFTGSFGALSGAEAINTGGDLYVATRTDTGWTSRYIGLPGNEAGCTGGPPNDPSSYVTGPNPVELQNTVLADPSLSHLLDFNDGEPFGCSFSNNGVAGADHVIDHPSNAPYLWNADGTLVQRLPTDLQSKPGALSALDCSYVHRSSQGKCKSDVTASGDLTHLVFSSNQLSFSEPGEPEGLIKAPGSAYDDNLTTGTVKLISTLKRNGEPISQDPVFANVPPARDPNNQVIPNLGGSEEFLRFPAVSTDGSRILISTATSGTPECDKANANPLAGCPHFTETPVHLYMSIDDEGAVEVSVSEVTHENVAVNYVGMNEDGSKVFFTSEEHLTGEDEGHGGASLYMWSQQGEKEGHPITLVSGANPGSPAGAGDTATCEPALVNKIIYRNFGLEEEEVPWTTRCSAVPYSSYPYSLAVGGAGGNGISDTGIASQSGDIYFYSPEQLDGNRGVPGQANLYDYRAGRLQFVATFDPKQHCIYEGPQTIVDRACSAGPVVRINVSPDDSHMAFVTSSRLTSYENAGHEEMYSYTPSTGAIVCDSCNPDGKPATTDVEASQDGLFMTDDGRTFFSTEERLVPQDTNKAEDVYEFVNGRPQLISSGTGIATGGTGLEGTKLEIPGLVGVSANGTDVYFSTFEGLLSEDQNGTFLRFYDARTDGGFAQPPPAQPCAAAEECHGPGTEAPALPTKGTAATLAGGNADPGSNRPGKTHHKRAKHKRHHRRAAGRHRGGRK